MAPDLIHQALTALQHKDFRSARECVRSYATEHPLQLQHYLIQGLSSLSLQDWQDAAIIFDKAVTVFPDQPHLWLNLGIALENLDESDRATQCYEHCLELKPDQAEAAGNLSNIYRRRGRFPEAEEKAALAFANGAPKGDALNALALAVGRQGRFDEAEKIFAEALQENPNQAMIIANQANLAVDQLKFEQAWLLFAVARAIDDDPIYRHHEAMARLLAGDFVRGWPLHEARLELPQSLSVCPACPQWKGEALAGKTLLLVSEQGFGDAIHFCRYGQVLASRGAELIWVVRKALHRLLAANVPGRVISEDQPIPTTDYWLPLLSLPYALGLLSPEQAPMAPYLKPLLDVRHFNLPPIKRRIGVVWSGSPTHERDGERTIPLELFAPLFEKITADYYAPAYMASEDASPLPKPFISIRPVTDFADTATLLNELDCLVTVDTATAHLAGAMGIETYLLLPYCPDWRWAIKGTTTPWYKSLHLIRQQKWGDWREVIKQLISELTKVNSKKDKL
jgi:Flp pilus assembly protein TadD